MDFIEYAIPQFGRAMMWALMAPLILMMRTKVPLGAGNWVAVRSAFSDVEAAAGYRVTASTLLKVAVRADRWTRSTNPGAPQANGYALVTQLSRTFDLVELARQVR